MVYSKAARMKVVSLVTSLMVVLFIGPESAIAGDTPYDLDLKRFNLEEVNKNPERWAIDGCSFTLWQADQDPWKSKYPFVFAQSLEGQKEVPGYLQIGKNFIPMKRAANGGEKGFYDLYPFMLYRSLDGKTLAYMEVNMEGSSPESAEIQNGSMRVMQTGRLPFTVKVVGSGGC